MMKPVEESVADLNEAAEVFGRLIWAEAMGLASMLVEWVDRRILGTGRKPRSGQVLDTGVPTGA